MSGALTRRTGESCPASGCADATARVLVVVHVPVPSPFLPLSLAALAAQDFPAGRTAVVVVVQEGFGGEGVDGTREKATVAAWIAQHAPTGYLAMQLGANTSAALALAAVHSCTHTLLLSSLAQLSNTAALRLLVAEVCSVS